MAATNAMSLDAFLGHKTKEGGSTQYLRGWRRRTPPAVDIWLHTKAPIVALWQHPWPRIHTREDKETGAKTREVWTGSFTSWETEEVVRRQYSRDKNTGNRKTPPEKCPMSLMLEEVRRLVVAGELGWTDELFRFEGDDPARAVVLHAGGMYGDYSGELTNEQKDQLRKAGIHRNNAWQENMMSKCNYLFRVVDNDAVDEGIQIAIETTLIGNKVKDVIRDAKTALGEQEGNPLVKPFAIRWEYVPHAKSFHDRYKAIRMERLRITSRIEELIVGAEPPQIDRVVKRGNIAALRTSMESYYVGPKGLLDWDAIFARAEAEVGPDEQSTNGAVNGAAAASERPRNNTREVECEMVACDECAGAMKATEMVCPHCGMDYSNLEQPQAAAAQPPPPAPTKKRSATAQPSGNSSSWPDQSGGADDDIPF